MNKEFWLAALTRCLRTICQTAIATIGTTALIQNVNWIAVGSASLLAGILSMLTSIATGLPEVEKTIEYRYVDENGVPIDGHYMLVHNVEEDVNDDCGECDLSKFVDDDIDENQFEDGDSDETS